MKVLPAYAVPPVVNIRRKPTATACPAGHPYDDANTYRHPRNGERSCRACKANCSRRRRAVSA